MYFKKSIQSSPLINNFNPMQKLFFRYKDHPGDLLRNSESIELPNPNDNLEGFLIWFLSNYQSDHRIAYLDDLYKLLYNEYSNEKDRLTVLNTLGIKTEKEIQENISSVENELKEEAYKSFYHLLLSNKIEVFHIATK
jgi:hypothetical protein